MGKVASAVTLAVLVALALSLPAAAQTNDNDYTPLNSRIRRSQQFPTLPTPNFVPYEKMSKVERDQGRSMLNQFSKCLYNRSHSGALELLDKTDFGFVNFTQIGLEPDKAAKIYGFHDCLGRVATSNNSGVALQYTALSLRMWMLRAAYLADYPKGPTWVKAGNVVEARKFPLSANNPLVKAEMAFADCVVSTDPVNADFFYRTGSGSAEEGEAVKDLTPALSACLPHGQKVQLTPDSLRIVLGEGLWQAANHNGPAPAAATQAGG
jgi:hypothetical protein